MSISTHALPLQRRATRALIKFIVDHDGSVDEDLRLCMEALESSNMRAAIEHARRVRPHGMGGLSDWFPPVVFAHENSEYVWAELEALVNQWCHVISLSMDEASET